METIYSITSDKGDKVYIGRTGQTLARRKTEHKYKADCTSKMLFEEYGFENCVFTALEECAKEQGIERERYHIENTPNVINKKIPGRTHYEYNKQWRKDNKEQRAIQWKRYKAKKKALQQIDVVLQ